MSFERDALMVCRTSAFSDRDHVTALVARILAEIAIKKDSKTLVESLEDMVEEASYVSIARSLERLGSVAALPNEFEEGQDGLDALCYHLALATCDKAIRALQAIVERFKAGTNWQRDKL